ncbi:MAG TPA: VWA domain-containing protein [Candidatus Acidoferrales bacterium]|nr:VWA domain-containing protein [Candidatus Acidoferrales bacterium]
MSILAQLELAKPFVVCVQNYAEAGPNIPMSLRLRNLLLLVVFAAVASPAQQNVPRPPQVPDDGKMHIDVVVTPKSGIPVEGLQQQDFTLLDNKSAVSIAGFQVFTGRQAPLEIVVVLDAVNVGDLGVNVQHEAVDRFLRTEGGQLPYPVALAVFTEGGLEIVGNFSLDGNALASALDKYKAGTRAVGAASGRNGADERWLLSQNALRALVASVAPHHRRKIILWISPGWSELPGLSAQIGDKQQQELFGDVVSMSTQFAKARVTLYSIDPVGAAESVATYTYYQQFLDPVTKLSQVDVADLGLPVLAIQSGGLALHSSNDLAESLKQCVSDALPFYEIAFDAATAEHPNEFHRLEVQLKTRGLTARTRQGYYAQPAARK